MEDQITTDSLNEPRDHPTGTQSADSSKDQIQNVRAELLTLAEKGEIKHSAAYIKKASQSAPEKIKAEYERKQLEETNEYITEALMEKLSEFMEATDMIDDAKDMEEELVRKKMVKRDLKNMLSYVTPYIPLIGIVCGVTTVGKHMYNKKSDSAYCVSTRDSDKNNDNTKL